MIPAAAAAAFIKGRGTHRFSHLHSSPPPPRVPFLCAPPPASLACLLSLSPLFPLPADTLAVEGRQLGLGVAAFCPHIPEPTNLGLSLWPDTPGPAMPSAGRQEVPRACLGLHSFSPESFLLPCPQGPWGHLHHDGALLHGAQPPRPPGGCRPPYSVTLRVGIIGLRQTIRRRRPGLLMSSCVFLFLPPRLVTSAPQGVTRAGAVMSLAIPVPERTGDSLAHSLRRWGMGHSGVGGLMLEGASEVAGWAPRGALPCWPLSWVCGGRRGGC